MNKRSPGFTLIELLVAISVLAILAVFSWRGLDEIVRTREALVINQADVEAIQRAFSSVARDARDVRAVAAAPSGRLELTLPAPRPKEPDPKVEYLLMGDRLVRRASDGSSEVMLDKVSALSSEVRHDDGSWGPAAEPVESVALRMSLRIAGIGEVRRIFLLRE